MRRLLVLVIAMVIASASNVAIGAERGQLDFLAGDWTLFDASGKSVGKSHIELQLPGAMIYEVRTDLDGKLPVWFVNSEAKGGWVQLFPGPAGSLREFTPLSKMGEWPLLLGSDAVLRDGRKVKFRLTMERASDSESRRALEMSPDGGAKWSTVFDYRYVRTVQR